MAEDRQQRIEELRRLIEKGEYALDSEDVAARLLDEQLEASALEKELLHPQSPIIKFPAK